MGIQKMAQSSNGGRLTFYLRLLMMFLQVGWLGAMWFTGAATSIKVPILMGFTLIIGLFFLFLPLRHQQILASWQESLLRYPTRWLIGLCIGVLLVGILYANYQRIWPFDEEMSHRASKLIAEEGVSTFFDQYQ
ncbi:hypothetical protein KFU94_62975 [Chloroflexi bacterium TSY]|nr:hypothetical protein [Chloroflexi bacterium TSY]MBV7338712.1 hypothetical protein [Chloroflexi bacterium TSY]MBV7338719.1 hypothetical protein [Chloroflexi bacterium TSY]